MKKTACRRERGVELPVRLSRSARCRPLPGDLGIAPTGSQVLDPLEPATSSAASVIAPGWAHIALPGGIAPHRTIWRSRFPSSPATARPHRSASNRSMCRRGCRFHVCADHFLTGRSGYSARPVVTEQNAALAARAWHTSRNTPHRLCLRRKELELTSIAGRAANNGRIRLALVRSSIGGAAVTPPSWQQDCACRSRF